HRHSPLPRELEYRIRHRNGDYRWFLSRSIGVHDAEGRLKRVVGIVGDVTERRQLEERRFHANKLETLGQLAGQIAHDFNNLLQVIVGNLQLAEESVPLADAHRSLIGDSLAAARSGAELTRQMLAFSRRQPLHASPLALDEFLEGFTRLAQRLLPETVTLTIHHRVPGLVFAVDRHQLESALLNLVLNARDALADGGGIDLIVASEECVAEETPPSWGEQLRPGPYLRFQVSDHGCGMAEDTLNRALEPFFSTKGDGGSGLGLSSAFGFARQAGGDLRLHSRPGAGTDAIIYLPRKTVNGAPARDIPRVPPPGNAGAFGQPLGRGERILVVEDRHDLRRFALRALKTLGYAPSGVEDAEGAREMLANGEPFHLVLADIRLPGAMDGLALGQWLRQHRPDIPVLYSTGHSEQIHQIASHQLLPKPYGLNQLAQALRRALG
ncbi:MAG: ATP-binding protein, partial [Candidatus Competibacterales bacterium]